ncbi:hypothetical protein MGY73_003022, partial [Enterococcus faecalis]|nr:hypothetical protein [Enterococcus faecalis]EIW9706568.1 hypothetical protein [Enterococcus faecalis]
EKLMTFLRLCNRTKIETAKNGGNVKEVMEIRLRSKLKSVLIVHYLKILYNRN